MDGGITHLENDYVDGVVEEALREDIGHGDLTTESLVDPALVSRAHLLSGEEAVLAGLEIFRRVFLHLDPGAEFDVRFRDGDRVAPGDVILEMKAKTEAIFKGERTALNFLQHLSGVATRTSFFLDELKGLPVTLLDTRKTTPGLRILEKYAVLVAGAGNHRFGLYDGILIKDNHRKVIDDLSLAGRKLKKLFPLKRIEIECSDMDEVAEALEAGADIILLDNMSPEDISRAVEFIGGRCLCEASGNIDLSNIREVAQTGVSYISAGTIIHGATFIDMSLEVVD